jgi:protein-L-isoaspartate(D-aspartate) O-methyltransferase
MSDNELVLRIKKALAVPEKIDARTVAVFGGGLFVGFLLALALSAMNEQREKIASYDEVMASSAIQKAQEVLENSGDDAASLLLSHESALYGEKKYDGQALAASMPIDSKEMWIAWMEKHRTEDRAFLEQRWELAQSFIRSHELWRPEDVKAFLLAPREKFVRERNKGYEYSDTWLPIGYGATITDPDVVAMMTSALEIKAGEKVLEIGTGSGYQSSILCSLTNEVYSIEIIKPLFLETDRIYRDLAPSYPAFNNITRKLGDGYFGWEKYGPFDKIIVTCAIDHIPPPLLKQMTPNAIMVLPMGPPSRQSIMQVVKHTDADGSVSLKRSDIYNGLGVHFIPFTDKSGKSYSASIAEEGGRSDGGM